QPDRLVCRGKLAFHRGMQRTDLHDGARPHRPHVRVEIVTITGASLRPVIINGWRRHGVADG
ncbi:hypothetical protein, partial [Jiangella asiatica]|uniref:hypothetical protein n=1 Tax=Jiangella asiatica TaxID=2530372 RepID=UPI00193D77A5